MAIGILDNWFGNKGSKDHLDELHQRAVQRLWDTEEKKRYEQMQAEANKAEYVRQLQAQYQQQIAPVAPGNLYNGLMNTGIGCITSASTDDSWGNGWGYQQAQYTVTNIPVTTTGTITTTNPGYYTIPNYVPGTVYQSTGAYPGWASITPTPAVTPQNPQVGDKLVMEWDGKDWVTRYETANTKPPPMKKVDFSLDEIEEAAELVNKLAKKQVEREAA